MRILIVYYSRAGHTKKVALTLQEMLGCDMEEIIDKRKRRGIWGYIISGYQSVKRRLTEIEPVKKDPAQYDLVLVGTPVWAGNMTPAIRTYLTLHGRKIKSAAFFGTFDGNFGKSTIREMEQLSCKGTLSVLGLTSKEVMAGAYVEAIKEFIGEMGIK